MKIIDNREKYDLKLARLISSDNDAYQEFTNKVMKLRSIDRHIKIAKMALKFLQLSCKAPK